MPRSHRVLESALSSISTPEREPYAHIGSSVTKMYKWGARKSGNSIQPLTPDPGYTTARSVVIPRFLSAVANRPHQPLIVDLGPVIGSNLSLFSKRLSCKFYIQDLFADIEAYAQRRERAPATNLADLLTSRFPQPPRSVDGILCWDLFDYLDPSTGRIFASKLTELLGTGGMLHGLFSTIPTDVAHYTRFVLDTEDSLRRQPYPATPTRRSALATRDIHLLFGGLEVTDLVLLKSATRETLFRRRR